GVGAEAALPHHGPVHDARRKARQANDEQTATVQANIDYGDERDAMLKLRVGMGIAPLVNAMFANSSISDGGLNGYMSFRGHIWTDTDRARCGLLPFVFRDGASFADYIEWALDVPLYFILRGGR